MEYIKLSLILISCQNQSNHLFSPPGKEGKRIKQIEKCLFRVLGWCPSFTSFLEGVIYNLIFPFSLPSAGKMEKRK